MKNVQKILFLALMVFVCTINSFAQLSYGVKAGLSLGWMTSLEAYGENKTPHIGYHAGGIFNYAINDKWAIEAAVELQNKGSISESKTIGSTVTATNNLMYIHIPINFQYQTTRFYVGAGPYIGIGLSGKFKMEGGPTNVNWDIKFGNSSTDHVAPIDIGLNLGGGYLLSNGLRFGVVYGYGLTDTTPKDKQISGEGAVRHILLAISVGYMFGR